MSRSLAKSRKAVVIKSLKERWEKSVQSAKVNGEKEIGRSSTVTGHVLTWATTFYQTVLVTTPPDFGTWTSFKAKFKDTFELCDTATNSVHWLSFHCLREKASTEEVSTYVTEFQNLWNNQLLW